LVVVVPNIFGDRHVLCDITITQAHKPEWGILLVPLCLRVPDTFVKGETDFKADVQGSLVGYMANPDDESYKAAADWKDLQRQEHVVHRVMSSLL
jgi:hypothetical protein